MAPSGAAMPSPSFTASWTFCTAFDTMSLPEVSRTMISAFSTGTPEAISVPSVRAKREIDDREMIGPKSGMLYLTQSMPYLPYLVRLASLYSTTMSTMPMTTRWISDFSTRLMPTTNSVTDGRGSPSSISVNIFSKFGTMKIIKPAQTASAIVSTTDG